ncbi:MAG: acetyl-CoA carboxylase carboxyltransferase subunit alpha [Candidatus Krumholzibacteria bacterium]|nr:acetyl-CoA carboxylase carboxyltransferase subunit alpha [Candidatus Krumholzibacteria bacterium]
MTETNARKVLDFEKPVDELQRRIERLKRDGTSSAGEIARLKEKLSELENKVYRDLSAWDRVQLARHPMRPTALDYIGCICDEFEELHGDRYFADDPALIGGLAKISGIPFMVIGQEKGRSTKEKIARNFGMVKPDGYRKSLRLMKLAEKFGLPILSLVDTQGAHPGIEAEERGQPRAIADNLKEVFGIATPIIVVVIGEGGSGGALAIAVGDSILMLEHAIYSVITPEGCAAILWKTREKAPDAAAALRLTSGDCLELGVIDGIIEEVHGAAHRDLEGNAARIRDAVLAEHEKLGKVPPDGLLKLREEKFYAMGQFEEG